MFVKENFGDSIFGYNELKRFCDLRSCYMFRTIGRGK